MNLSTLQKDYRGKDVILVDRDGDEVVLGNTYKDFRGDDFTIIGCRAPHKAGSSGFVHSEGREVYAAVIGARWVCYVPVTRV